LTAGQQSDSRPGIVGEIDQVERLADRARIRVEAREDRQGVADGELGVQTGRLENQADPRPCWSLVRFCTLCSSSEQRRN
jgi:hypothetical protein